MNPRTVKARKQYRCDFCEGLIEKGTKYVYERCTPWDHPDNEGYGTVRGHIRCKDFWDDEYGPDSDWNIYIDTSFFKEKMLEYSKEPNKEEKQNEL